MSEEEVEQPIIIKKIKKGGGHHGGAWKVAYADFVTAMMAFFLLLWLLNVSTDEQRNAISNYFDPTHPKVSSSQSGAGGVMGGLSMSPKGAMVTDVQDITRPPPFTTRQQTVLNVKSSSKKEAAKAAKRQQEDKAFKKAADKLKAKIANSPELKALSENLMIDLTPEGLRIQIIDRDGDPMFPSGSAKMFTKTRNLLAAITDVILPLENEVSVRGHTDAVPYGSGSNYTNWELSSDRANASRRVLLESALPLARLNNVMGKAATELLIEDTPTDPRNRRITLLLLRQEITNPEMFDYIDEDSVEDEGAFDEQYENETTPNVPPVGTFKKTPGKIEFP